MKEKIGLPTDDKLNISECFYKSKFFKIATVERGKILEEEFRENLTFRDDDMTLTEIDKEKICMLISDCNVLLANDTNESLRSYMSTNKKEIVVTPEKNITNALIQYLVESNLKESNTCCCP